MPFWIFDDRFQPEPDELDPRFQPVATVAQAPFLFLPDTHAGAINVTLIPTSSCQVGGVTMNKTRISNSTCELDSRIEVIYFY